VWRPLKGPVKDAPLAFCDYFSLEKSDAVAADVILADHIGEVYYLHYNKTQQWYWFRNQMPDEVVIFKSFDSRHDFGAACKSIYCAKMHVKRLK
jgi:hypothetical protein